ncbi:MAG TPA: hypothetical protein VHC90_11055 [Bryobacteraceae bacterium]|nr:hypothetical protein [Bryobacteraceae bacterium]
MADFILIAQRTFAPGTTEYKVLIWHFLLGADWKLCMHRLAKDGIRFGNERSFFHLFYRIESNLGRAFAETEPYGIYPLDEYFGGTTHDGERPRTLALVPKVRDAEPVRPPLKTRVAAA